MKNKYDNYYYWENIIRQEKSGNPFEDVAITEESVFFRGVIVNCNKSNNYDNLAHFPCVKALLGYINYVFIPMAFFNLLSLEDQIVSPQSSLDEMLDIMEDSDKCHEKDLIPRMREFSFLLRMFWNLNDESLFIELRKFLVSYNERWNDILDKFSHFEIFRTPLELGNYLLDTYESSEEFILWILGDQLGISEDEWIDICDNVYENEFMRRRFTEILNTRIVQF